MNKETLYNDHGQRLYLTAEERQAFFDAAKKQKRPIRTFCHTLYYTGCRISEALELAINRVDMAEETLIFRTLKKRNGTQYRGIPVPSSHIDSLDMVHGVRDAQKKQQSYRLWPVTRTSAWRHVKAVMVAAGIDTTLPHATAKGLRHAFGIHAVASSVPLTEVQKLMGHSSVETTALYLNAQGKEKRALVSRMWEA